MIKFYKKFFIIFIVPHVLCATLDKELLLLTKNLLILSQQLKEKEPLSGTKPEVKKEQEKNTKETETTIKKEEESLLQEISIYKKDPLKFAQKLKEQKLNQIKNQLIQYLSAITSLAEKEDKDIDIDDTILNFIRIALDQKSVEGAKSEYALLHTAIQNNRHDDVEKYAKRYITNITKNDFLTAITNINNKINNLADKITDLNNVSLQEKQSLYEELKKIEQTIKFFMLPETETIETLKKAEKSLKITLNTTIKKAEEIIDKKYKELEKENGIKNIENEYKEKEENLARKWKKGTSKEYNEELEKIRDAKKHAIIGYITHFFYSSQEDLTTLFNACITASNSDSPLCKALQNVHYIKTTEGTLHEWSDSDIVKNYHQKDTEIYLNELQNFIRKLKEMFNKTPLNLEEKVNKAKTTLINHLSVFKEFYTQFIHQQKAILETVVHNPSQSSTLYHIERYCEYLELIAQEQNTKIDESIKFICIQAKEKKKEIEQKGIWGN